jgi:hypothetical protein
MTIVCDEDDSPLDDMNETTALLSLIWQART